MQMKLLPTLDDQIAERRRQVKEYNGYCKKYKNNIKINQLVQKRQELVQAMRPNNFGDILKETERIDCLVKRLEKLTLPRRDYFKMRMLEVLISKPLHTPEIGFDIDIDEQVEHYEYVQEIENRGGLS